MESLEFFLNKLILDLPGKHVSQCSLKDLQCLRTNRHIFSSIQPHDYNISYNRSKLEGMECNCYPSCTEQVNIQKLKQIHTQSIKSIKFTFNLEL